MNRKEALTGPKVPSFAKRVAAPAVALASVLGTTQDAVAQQFEAPVAVEDVNDSTKNEVGFRVLENGDKFFMSYIGFNYSTIEGAKYIPAGSSTIQSVSLPSDAYLIEPITPTTGVTFDQNGDIYSLDASNGWTNSINSQLELGYRDYSLGGRPAYNDGYYTASKHLGGSTFAVRFSDNPDLTTSSELFTVNANIYNVAPDIAQNNRVFYERCDINGLDCDTWMYDINNDEHSEIVPGGSWPYFKDGVLYVSINDGTYNNPDFNVYSLNEIVEVEDPDLDAPIMSDFTLNGVPFNPSDTLDVDCNHLDDPFVVEANVSDEYGSPINVSVTPTGELEADQNFDSESGTVSADLDFFEVDAGAKPTLSFEASDESNNQTSETIQFNVLDECKLALGSDTEFTENQFADNGDREVELAGTGKLDFSDIADDYTVRFENMDIYADITEGDSTVGVTTGVIDRSNITASQQQLLLAAMQKAPQYLTEGTTLSDEVAYFKATDSIITIYDAVGKPFLTLQPGQDVVVSGDYIHSEDTGKPVDTDEPVVDDTGDTGTDEKDTDVDTGFQTPGPNEGCGEGCSQGSTGGPSGLVVIAGFLAAAMRRRKEEEEAEEA